jgi:peptidoglycan/LPS O-acetylase OafA/YrhL
MQTLTDFLGGAVSLAYLVAGLHFLRFWRKTGDRLFLHFAIAFGLFMLNQVVVSLSLAPTDQTRYAYVLRVIGFLLILVAIVGKNTSPPTRAK